MDLYAIPLHGFDIVLGCEWLRTLGPILWDLTKLSMTFWRHDHRVTRLGIHAELACRLALADARDLMALLLEESGDLFAAPIDLLPQRSFDHRIDLLPDTPPVAVRLYRYTQLLKDEIEAQCQAMLDQGIIRANTSAFSSPVLLVRKRDHLAVLRGLPRAQPLDGAR